VRDPAISTAPTGICDAATASEEILEIVVPAGEEILTEPELEPCEITLAMLEKETSTVDADLVEKDLFCTMLYPLGAVYVTYAVIFSK
jgi:hypothetical protein